ncbi:Uncharacterised protein [Sphingobacterium daejeonense]|nr:Uncharacterised protein [Sphingobacterium daejeonense]
MGYRRCPDFIWDKGHLRLKIRVSDQIDPYDPNVRVNLKITDPCTTGFL